MSRPETVERWRQRIRRFESANMTVAQFCQSEGVSQPSFYKWKKTILQLPQPPAPRTASPEVNFRPLRLTAPTLNCNPLDAQNVQREQPMPPTVSTIIELPGGVRIRIEVPTDWAASGLGETLRQEAQA